MSPQSQGPSAPEVSKHEPPRRPVRGRWLRLATAFAPFAWLAVAMLLASILALAVQLALPGGPDAGVWNPFWSYAEVEVEALDARAAEDLVDAARLRLPGRVAEWRPAEGGGWVVLSGSADRAELLAELRQVLPREIRTTGRIGFGSNLARQVVRLRADPAAAAEAVSAFLPLALYGGGLVLLILGAVLLRRLRADLPPGPRPVASPGKRVLVGVGLGVTLVLLTEGLAALLAALGHPVVEQPWIVDLFERRGPALYAALPMIVGIAPVAEEVFFRGYMLEALVRPWGRLGAIALSSAAFAAVHGHGPALPVYFLYGVCLALAARRSGSLLIPIAAHVTVNTLSVSARWLGVP